MGRELPDPLSWSHAASARLRLVQGSCGDLPAQQRRMHIGVELDHLLGDVPADRRAAYVTQLLARFPDGEQRQSTAVPHPSPQDLGSPFTGPPETAEDLVEKLIAYSRNLTPQRREQLAARLGQAGLATGRGESSSLVTSDLAREAELALSVDVLKAKLDLPPDRPLDLLRMVRLLSVALDVLEKLDHMVWSIWKRIAPRSKLQPSAYGGRVGFREKVALFLDGQSSDSPEALASSIDHSSRMTVALLNGLGLGGRQFAKRHLAQIAPENIALEARREGGSFMQTLEHRSWQRYEYLCRDLTPDALEAELREEIARSAEALYATS